MIQIIADRLRFVAQTVVKRVKQMTRPANGSRTSNLVMDMAQQLKEATPWSKGPRFLIHCLAVCTMIIAVLPD